MTPSLMFIVSNWNSSAVFSVEENSAGTVYCVHELSKQGQTENISIKCKALFDTVRKKQTKSQEHSCSAHVSDHCTSPLGRKN